MARCAVEPHRVTRSTPSGLRNSGSEFVYIYCPQYAQGATAGNTPPAALGQPRPDRRTGQSE